MKHAKPTVDKTMLAYCGLYCGQCAFKTAHDTGDSKHLAAIPYRFTVRDLSVYNCGGCKGVCICGVCKIKPCASARNIDSCADCTDFPCPQITAFEQDGIPHHKSAVENLRTIRQYGIAHWFAQLTPALRCPHCGERQSWYYTCQEHGNT